MRYRTFMAETMSGPVRNVIIEQAPEQFTSFCAQVGNLAYDSFLESQSLTDAEVQAMTPDIWHDMA
jgi:hypothetical protein